MGTSMSNIVYTISARGKPVDIPIGLFLQRNFSHLNPRQIDSVFGFLEYCPIYGGRRFVERQISNHDVAQLYANNIGVRIPLTSHYVSVEEYDTTRTLLDKYYRKGNSIITTDDTLASWIKRDYPLYGLEASVIKEIDTQDKIDKALELYDTVILPMRFCIEFDFLDSLKNKDKITLFANAGCAYNCPAKICYKIISKSNKTLGRVHQTGPTCSKETVPREELGVVDFDINKIASLGFKRFKLLRPTLNRITGY